MNGFHSRIRNSLRQTDKVVCSNPNGTAFLGIPNRSVEPKKTTSISNETRSASTHHVPEMENAEGGGRPNPSPSSSSPEPVSVDQATSAPESTTRPWYQKVPRWGWWLLFALLFVLIVWIWTSSFISSRTEQFLPVRSTPPNSNEEDDMDMASSSESISLPYDKVWDEWIPIT